MSSSAIVAGLICSPAVAQTTGSATAGAQIEEVVVTARKREESLQQVPVAVTAATGEVLEQQGIRTPTDLGKIVPSLTVAPSASQNSAAVFSLRGQAAGDILLTVSQPVGIYIDNGNVPHPAGLLSSFFDLERIEVLKGPQGTLYGRNTTGGAVNIITRSADYAGLHGFVGGEAGDYNHWKINGAINVPIIEDQLALRVAYQHWNREGYGKSRITGQDLGGDHDDDLVRVSLHWDPTSYLSGVTKFEYTEAQQNGYLITTRLAAPIAHQEAGVETGCGTLANRPALEACGALALAPDIDTGDLFTNSAQSLYFDNVKTWHAVEDLNWYITDDLTLRSISSFHKVYERQAFDLDATRFQILEVNQNLIAPFAQAPTPRLPDYDYEAVTQELNLSGSVDRLDWLVGAFGSWEEGRGGQHSAVTPRLNGGVDSFASVSDRTTTDTWALYTQNDIKFSDQVSLTLGARYTEERQTNRARQYTWLGGLGRISCTNGGGVVAADQLDRCGVVTSSIKSTGTSYLASLNFQFTPDTLFYVKTARGFRGGALQFRAPQLPGVKPEIATDYEIGVKADFFDHRLRMNLAAYHTNYSNKQETTIILAPNGNPTTVLQNAATAQINGFEGEVRAVPIAGLSLYGTVTYLEGTYDDYENPLSGDSGGLFAGDPVCAARPAVVPPQCIAHGIPFSDPNWRYSLGARYEHEVGPGTLSGQLDWSWRAKSNVTALNVINAFGEPGRALQREFFEARGLLNGRIEYQLPEQQVTLALFGTNLLDENYQTQALGSFSLGFFTGATAEPRMWGVSIRKAFGDE